MAMFHFRIKSDKKPNGTKISAVQHVEYINREGKFSTLEQWQEENKFGGDFISSEKFPNAFSGQNFLLYKTDDFGSIRNSQRGIEVTKNASEETIATALLLAYEIMNHQPLVINGSDDFKKVVLKTAVHKDLPISFDDLSFQNDFLRYKEVDYPDRKKFALTTAQKILQRIEKTNAQSHLEYINREKAYENIRVDHRTLQAQKEEAEHNGDSSLARLFSRVPEKYIGVISCQDYEEPRLERLKIFRGLRERHFDLVMKLDSSTKEAEELEVKDDAQFVSSRLKALMESKEYKSQKFVDPILADLKNKMLTAVAQVNRWKRSIISQYDAELQAKMEYMTKTERKLWLKYFETLAQKNHLEHFLKSLKKPDETNKEATRAFELIVSGVKTQIADLDTSLTSMKKPLEDIRRRLELPDSRNNILLVTHQILQANTHARKMLKRSNIDLDKAVDDLRNANFLIIPNYLCNITRKGF